MRYKASLPILFAIVLNSCVNKDTADTVYCNGGKVELVRIHDSLNVLKYSRRDSVLSEWELRYPVYHLDHGDLNGNGKEEIVVGVIKKTRFFPETKKRLFIYKINNKDHIRPLWLGSRVGTDLIDFKVERDSVPARIVTYNVYKKECYPEDISEENLDGTVFKLGPFGLKFEHFRKKN